MSFNLTAVITVILPDESIIFISNMGHKFILDFGLLFFVFLWDCINANLLRKNFLCCTHYLFLQVALIVNVRLRQHLGT